MLIRKQTHLNRNILNHYRTKLLGKDNSFIHRRRTDCIEGSPRRRRASSTSGIETSSVDAEDKAILGRSLLDSGVSHETFEVAAEELIRKARFLRSAGVDSVEGSVDESQEDAEEEDTVNAKLLRKVRPSLVQSSDAPSVDRVRDIKELCIRNGNKIMLTY